MFQHLYANNMANPYPRGSYYKELIAVSPFTFKPTMADNFPTLPTGNSLSNMYIAALTSHYCLMAQNGLPLQFLKIFRK
jgi:hypothetical protein